MPFRGPARLHYIVLDFAVRNCPGAHHRILPHRRLAVPA